MPTYLERPFIAVGYHRSGTSLLAGLLNICGINMGDEMFPALSSNPKGHFEEINILNFHRAAMLEACGTDGGISIPPSWEGVNMAFKPEKALEAVKKGFASYRDEKDVPWGFKDPRTLPFLRHWKTLFPEARILLTIRHPLAVAESLKRRDHTDNANALRSWYVFHQGIMDFLGNQEVGVFLYDNLVANPTLLVDFFEVRKYSFDMLGFVPSGKEKAMRAFTDPELRHVYAGEGSLPSCVNIMWNSLLNRVNHR